MTAPPLRAGMATAALALLLSSAGCERERVDARPERVVEEIVDRMQRVHDDPKAARAAYELLAQDTRQDLGERAKRASAVVGRPLAPEEMIAPSRFALRFAPRRYEARIDGRTATVTVTGESAETQRAEVRCVREDSGWRVALELPPVSPIVTRDPQ